MKWFLYSSDDFNINDYNRCLELMEAGRKEKLLSGKHIPTREMSVYGEWAVKTELSKISGMATEKIKLNRTKDGKPYAENLPFCFNISHSVNFLSLVIDQREIGIDIEVIKPIKTDITKILCTKSDIEFLSDAKDEREKLIRFYKIWTAKEAYFKMLGTGITKLKSISYCELKPLHYFENNCIITIIRE